eukprot:425239-Prymnesium_polylepis.1
MEAEPSLVSNNINSNVPPWGLAIGCSFRIVKAKTERWYHLSALTVVEHEKRRKGLAPAAHKVGVEWGRGPTKSTRPHPVPVLNLGL